MKLQQIQKNIINIYDFISEKTGIDLSKTDLYKNIYNISFQNSNKVLKGGSNENKTCPICFENVTNNQLILEDNLCKSKKKYHKNCLKGWLETGHETCPTCRQVFTNKNYTIIMDNHRDNLSQIFNLILKMLIGLISILLIFYFLGWWQNLRILCILVGLVLFIIFFSGCFHDSNNQTGGIFKRKSKKKIKKQKKSKKIKGGANFLVRISGLYLLFNLYFQTCGIFF